jgi:hypothetical protein
MPMTFLIPRTPIFRFNINMITIWYITVWDGHDEIDHLFIDGQESQDDVVEYMLNRVYGEKTYDFAKDVQEGTDVLLDYTQGNANDVEIYCTNLIPDVSIVQKRATMIQDLDYIKHKMKVFKKEK